MELHPENILRMYGGRKHLPILACPNSYLGVRGFNAIRMHKIKIMRCNIVEYRGRGKLYVVPTNVREAKLCFINAETARAAFNPPQSRCFPSFLTLISEKLHAETYSKKRLFLFNNFTSQGINSATLS